MKKTTGLVLTAVVTSVAIWALGAAQSGSKRRTPVLTTDDLGSAREVNAPAMTGTEVSPSLTRSPEVVRGSVAWHRDLRRAFDVARDEDKLVIADVYTDWCGWCKKMDKTIYSDPSIVALSGRQVFVKVDAEDGGEGQRFAQRMGIRGYPTTIILDGGGKVLKIARGYIDSPRRFELLVQEALNR